MNRTDPHVATRPLDRVLPLQGGQNFRDMGGYAAADGRSVRWHRLFRSGSMHHLTESDLAYLAHYDLKSIIDFRAKHERDAEPPAWEQGNGPYVYAGDYAAGGNPIFEAVRNAEISAEEARAAMIENYADMPQRLSPHYRAMFARLKEGHAPLVINCSAGKDRTGVGAALILTALGVSREDVIADYLLSNEHYRPYDRGEGMRQQMARYPKEVLDQLLSAQAVYLETALDVILGAEAGAAYYRDVLGMSQDDIARLRDDYLE